LAVRSTATTNRSGNFATSITANRLKGYSVRVAYYSRIPIVANQWYYLPRHHRLTAATCCPIPDVGLV
jgi:hypothetical protein